MVLLLDRIARIGMALGILLIFQPWWAGGLRLGFMFTLVFTILHIITSHMFIPDESESG